MNQHQNFLQFIHTHLWQPRLEPVSRNEKEHHGEEERFFGKSNHNKQDTFETVPIGEHVLPPLPYPYNALEPYIDEKTMRLHHDEHHKEYVEGLNQAERQMQEARKTGDFSLIKHWEREAAFNGAGHYLIQFSGITCLLMEEENQRVLLLKK